MTGRRAYDHRLRERVHRNEPVPGLRQLRIPRSTRSSWRCRAPRAVVTLDAVDQDRQQLLECIDRLERRVALLTPVVRLAFAIVRASGFQLSGERLPEGDTKRAVLDAIGAAVRLLPLAVVLKILRFPPSRYHAWRRAAATCGLDDRSACPRMSPQQLSAVEAAAIKDMVLDPSLRHMPLRALSLYAQRIGRVFASVTTWARLIRERGWRRSRTRVHPAKPTRGVRARKPNELWHIDATIVRLRDGTRAYIHAVIDNYSRKILAWTVAARLSPSSTIEVLVAAKRHLAPATGGDGTLVYADSGVENVNATVDATVLAEGLRLVLAQVHVAFSNSMIEAFWRSLKHNWLYLNSLDSIDQLRTLVAFFVDEHNRKMPHAAFSGQTPDEIYAATAAAIAAELAAARKAALAQRLAANRATSCHQCETDARPPQATEPAVPPDSIAIPTVTLLRTVEFGMS